jgi:hypothetical protein
MPFFVSAESGVDAVSERRQTEPAAIGLALDYIDRGFSANEIKDAGSGAEFCEEFLLAYSAMRLAMKLERPLLRCARVARPYRGGGNGSKSRPATLPKSALGTAPENAAGLSPS